MPYYSTKTYDHGEGLSVCFRQWKAKSHCNLLHGYALSFTLVFGANTLDDRNWVVDFGGLKEIKEWLKTQFDHRTIVAADDPKRHVYEMMRSNQMIDPVILPDIGCEAFAKYVFDHISEWLRRDKDKHAGLIERVWLESVECREHNANSALYTRNMFGEV